LVWRHIKQHPVEGADTITSRLLDRS